MGQATFEWGDGSITVTSTTVKSRLLAQRFYRLVNANEGDETMQELMGSCLFYLAHVDKVEGDVGFHIPNGDTSYETLHQFVDEFLEQDERLMYKWDNAIASARNITNEPDLLPPEELEKNA